MGNKDYKEVSDFTKDLALAESGDAMGMIGVAHRYYNGIGVNIDRNKSFEWYNKAASEVPMVFGAWPNFFTYREKSSLRIRSKGSECFKKPSGFS